MIVFDGDCDDTNIEYFQFGVSCLLIVLSSTVIYRIHRFLVIQCINGLNWSSLNELLQGYKFEEWHDCGCCVEEQEPQQNNQIPIRKNRLNAKLHRLTTN